MGVFFGAMVMGFFGYFVARITQALTQAWYKEQAQHWPR